MALGRLATCSEDQVKVGALGAGVAETGKQTEEAHSASYRKKQSKINQCTASFDYSQYLQIGFH